MEMFCLHCFICVAIESHFTFVINFNQLMTKLQLPIFEHKNSNFWLAKTIANVDNTGPQSHFESEVKSLLKECEMVFVTFIK